MSILDLALIGSKLNLAALDAIVLREVEGEHIRTFYGADLLN